MEKYTCINIPGITGMFTSLGDLKFSDSSLLVTLTGRKEQDDVRIRFKGRVIAYQSTDESYDLERIDYLLDLKKKYEFMIDNTLYFVEHSNFLKQIEEEQGDQLEGFFHIAVLTEDYFLDVITDCIPTIALEEECNG